MRPVSATAKTITTTAAGTGGGILIATHLPLLAGLACLLLTMLFLGVVLPAVWSTRHTRRAAALTVLKEILTLYRRPDPSSVTRPDPGPPSAGNESTRRSR